MRTQSTKTGDPEGRAALSAAKLLRQLDEFLGEDGLEGLVDRLKAVEDVVGPIKRLDMKALLSEHERMRAGQKRLQEQIRTSRLGGHFPGIEDAGENFSVLRAMIGRRQGGDNKLAWESAGAGYEYEVISQASKKLREIYTKAGHQVGDDRSAGSFIPDQVIPDVIGGIYTRSVFVALEGEGETRVSVLEGLQGGSIRIPQFNGGLIAYWIGEEDEYAESLTDTADVTMSPKKMGILVKITQEMKTWAAFGFEALLRKDMMRAAAKKLDFTVAYGTGTNFSPRGITKTNGIRVYSAQSKKSGILGTDALGGAQFQADWAGAELDFDGLDNMRLEVEEADVDYDETAVTIGAPRYFSRLRQLKVSNFSGQTTDRPYLIGMPMLPDSRLADIIGPFAKSNQIKKKLPGSSVGAPTTSSNVKFADVFGGNLGNVILGRWAGIEIEDDAGKGKGFTSDSIYMKLRMYGDTCIRHPLAVAVCPDARILD